MLFFIFSVGGRRIVDVMHIFDQIRNGNHGIGLGCTFIDCELLKEVRSGYFSSWIFKCKMCNMLTKIESEKMIWGVFQLIRQLSVVHMR